MPDKHQPQGTVLAVGISPSGKFVPLQVAEDGTPATAGGGGGGGGSSGSVTAAGTNGTAAQAVQGINDGVPVRVMDEAYDPIYDKLIVGNARGKIRDGFDTFDTVNDWQVLSTGTNDYLEIDGNAAGASYLKIGKSPFNPNTVTEILSRKTFKLPVRVALGFSLTQRIAGQEFTFDLIGVDTNGSPLAAAADTAKAVSSITTAVGVWTINTTAPHGYVVGDRVALSGFADSRFNYCTISNGVITSTPSPTQFTINSNNLSNASSGAGFVTRINAAGTAMESAGFLWNGVNTNNANNFTRSGSNSTWLQNETGFGSTASSVLAGYNVQGTYAFTPTTVFEMVAQMESVHWWTTPVDSLNAPTQVKRTQCLPDIEREFKLRIRAVNLPSLTYPVGDITAAAKTGTAVATITLPNHGLTVGDQITIYGIRDQVNFANLTTATAVASVIDANNFTISFGAAVTASSAGGIVYRVQGGVVAVGQLGQVVQSISRTSNLLTVTGNTNWSGISIGDTVWLAGLDGSAASYEGRYRVWNISTTTLVLESVGADFTSINCGGVVIRGTDARLHFARALDYTRHLTEVVGGLNRADQNSGVGVAVVNTPAVTISGTPTVSISGNPILGAGANVIGGAFAQDNIFYNETVTNLAASATFTGTSRDTGVAAAAAHRYSAFNATVFADQAGTFRIEMSNDNTTWRAESVDTAVAANTPLIMLVLTALTRKCQNERDSQNP